VIDRRKSRAQASDTVVGTLPSDVIWTGLITGGVGLGGILATALTSFGQRGLERERLAAEGARIHDQHREDERRERRTAYHRYLVLFNTLDTYATGFPPEDDEALKTTMTSHNDAVAAVDLFGTSAVRTALNEVRRLNRTVGSAMASPLQSGESLADAFTVAWNTVRDALVDAQRGVVTAMREDVGPLPPAGVGE